MTPLNADALAGRHVIITSGPTHESIDPVRFIGNRSSGKQGHAIAAAFAAAGARVTLVSGPVSIPDPAGVTCVHVETAQQMLDAVTAALPADIAVCAAAVADWRPKNVVDHKMKKRANEDELSITLVRNADILRTLGHSPARPPVLVGFAAETNDILSYARGKLVAKNADLILANDVSGGAIFGSDATHLVAVTASGHDDWGPIDKLQAATRIVAAATELLHSKTT